MQVKMRAQEYYKTTFLSAFGPLTNVVVISLDPPYICVTRVNQLQDIKLCKEGDGQFFLKTRPLCL